jgi:hypothetical protein
MPESADDAITTPEDLTSNEGNKGRTSTYLGVFKIRRRNGTERWRVKFCLKRKSYHVGEFEKEIDAALVYDNVTYYVAQEFKQTPVLNFPKTYASVETLPAQWAATRRVLKKIKADTYWSTL